MSNNYLQKLRELTDNLPFFPSLVMAESNNRIDYDVENGISFSFGLMNNEKIAVADTFMREGTVFPEHLHNEREFLIVYEGALSVKRNGDDVTYIISNGESIYFEENELHIVTALEDTWVVSITIPAAEGYPNERIT